MALLKQWRGKNKSRKAGARFDRLPEFLDHGTVHELPIDVYQSESEVIIYAQLPNANLDLLDVSIDETNTMVTIVGVIERPKLTVDIPADAFVLEECRWGAWYREIVLPAEVDADDAEATTKEGVLVVRLGFKNARSKSVRVPVIRGVD